MLTLSFIALTSHFVKRDIPRNTARSASDRASSKILHEMREREFYTWRVAARNDFNAIVNMSRTVRAKPRTDGERRGPWSTPGLLYWLVNDEPRRSGSQQPRLGRGSTRARTDTPLRVCLRLLNYVRVSRDARKNGHVA